MHAPELLAATSNWSTTYGLEWAGLVLVAVVFWRKLRPVLVQAMNAQAERIRASLEAGEQARLEAEKVLERARTALADAKAEAESLVEQARHAAARQLEEGGRRAEEDYARVVARAETEIGLERARIAEEISAEMSALVVRYATRIVEDELDASTQHRLFGEVIEAAEAEAS